MPPATRPPRQVTLDRIRNDELGDVVTRRLAAGLWPALTLAESVGDLVRQGLLPEQALGLVPTRLGDAKKLQDEYLKELQQGWETAPPYLPFAPERVAEILARRWSADWLRPDNLKEMLQRWANAGLLPPAAGKLPLDEAFFDKEPLLRALAAQAAMTEPAVAAQGLRALLERHRRALFREDTPAVWAFEAILLEALFRDRAAGDLVGLAFSGGGIRSASFNLGLLQALQEDGVLRDVDYLSTVSGGGYIGSHFSALAQRDGVAPVNGPFPLAPEKGGKQPQAVLDFIRGGTYLNWPAEFFNRWLTGLIYNNLVLVSIIVFVAATVAYAWRWLDTPPVHTALIWVSRGRLVDVYRPFLPAALLLLAWLVLWTIAYWHRTLTWNLSRRGRFLIESVLLCLTVAAATRTPRDFWSGAAELAGLSDRDWSILSWTAVMVVLLFTAINAGLVLREALGKYLCNRVGLALAVFVLAVASALALHLAPYFCPLVPAWAVGCATFAWPWGYEGVKTLSRCLLVVALACVLIGGAMWLGNPNLNTYSPTQLALRAPGTTVETEDPAADKGATRPEESSYLTRHQNLLVPLLMLVVVCLLPFLRPGELLRSGEQPRSARHAWVFRLASSAALCGLPFLVIYYLGRLNVSGRAADLERPLSVSDIGNWEEFWYRARQEERDQTGAPAGNLLTLIRQRWFLNPQTQAVLAQGAFLAATPGASPLALAAPCHELGDLEVSEAHREDYEALTRVLAVVNDPNRVRVFQWRLPDRAPELPRLPWSDYAGQLRDQELVVRVVGETLGDPELSDTLVAHEYYTIREKAELLKRQKGKGGTGVLSTAEEMDLLVKLLDRRWHDLEAAPCPDGDDVCLTAGQRRSLNHLLLRAYYPGEIRPVTMVLRTTVIKADQRYRLWVMAVAGTLALLGGLLVNLNATSPQQFYRDRLAAAYLGADGEALRLRDLRATDKGAPYHLLSGAVNGLRTALHHDLPGSFLFSRRYCGSYRTGYEATATYYDGELLLADAMSVSGAAVSPMQVKNPLVAFLMTMLNLRLGLWLPRGTFQAAGGPIRRTIDWLRQWPTMAGLWLDWLHHFERHRLYFISDGGHDENLGVEQLLARRCRLILASDATEDQNFEFGDLAKLYRRVRLHGIRLAPLDPENPDAPLSLEGLSLDRAAGHCYGHFLAAKILYPDGPSGTLVYLKPSCTSREEMDLLNHRAAHPAFPHDSTLNQMYDENHVESYRQLGYAIGKKLFRELSARAAAPANPLQTNPPNARFEEVVV